MSKKPSKPDPLRTAPRRNSSAPGCEVEAALCRRIAARTQCAPDQTEMQNEQLRQAQDTLEESRDRYADLYEFAPVGYLTLNHDGVIDKINLTCARCSVWSAKTTASPLCPFRCPGGSRTAGIAIF